MDENSATLTEELARLALRNSELTAPRRTAAVRSLFDYCTCVLAANACNEPSWALDRAGRLSVLAHAQDLDDLHLATATHPGGVIWSAVVPCALEQNANCRDALASAAYGYEIVIRMAGALGPRFRQSWHATTALGIMGAAAAASRLLCPDEEQLVDALGHAISVSGGSAQAMIERSETRLLHRAHAASTGVSCARAASSGLRATRLGLESGRGAFAAARADTFTQALLVSRSLSALEETGFRLYAATGFAHAAMDAAAMIGKTEPSAIENVYAAVSPAARANASNRAPLDDDAAWWSVEHAVASTLTQGSALAIRRGLADRADVLDLCARVELRDGGSDWGADIQVEMADGTVRSASTPEPHGHLASPASSEDLCAKWERLVGGDGSPFLAALSEAADTTRFYDILREGVRSESALLATA